tara:strand:- start:214 stop:441 length:228 start_codon:yes stop_codon:yes gene_type:complete
MTSDFLDNLAANQYQKMHNNKPHELREVVGDKIKDLVEKELITDAEVTHTSTLNSVGRQSDKMIVEYNVRNKSDT